MGGMECRDRREAEQRGLLAQAREGVECVIERCSIRRLFYPRHFSSLLSVLPSLNATNPQSTQKYSR